MKDIERLSRLFYLFLSISTINPRAIHFSYWSGMQIHAVYGFDICWKIQSFICK